MVTDNQKTNLIPIFFAVDDRYAPYLSVALCSLIENASPSYDYRIHILIDDLSEDIKARILSMQKENVQIDFVRVREKLAAYAGKLHLRDYYTQATYYRFFIPTLFPEYEKCMYLDCDILVLGDISRMFAVEMGDALMAAVTDDVITTIPVFREYAERFLGIAYEKYFNAGILLMNLSEMRRIDIEKALLGLMEKRSFPVAQDQDYLNVLCYERMIYLDGSWNRTAFPDAESLGVPNIVHFKIHFRPWHYEGISFGDLFWKYAEKTEFFTDIQTVFHQYTDGERDRDAAQYAGLVALAEREMEKVCENYELPTVFSVGAMTKKE